MILDTRTILAVDTIVVLALAAALQFYRAHQRTYPGFTAWVLSMWFMAAAYLALVLRGVIPPVVSIFLANACFSVAAVARLDGALRFTGDPALRRAWYAVPLAAGVLCTVAPLYDNTALRSQVIAVTAGGFAVAIGVQFIRRAPNARRTPYLVVGLLHFVFAAAIVARSLAWLTEPQVGMLDTSPLHSVFFITITVFEVLWAVAFTMMHANRLEAELLSAQAELATTVSDLRSAVGKVKTLSGLLPICCSCQRIRNDEGYWKVLHEYLADNQGLQLTHGICPECQNKLYPGLLQDV